MATAVREGSRSFVPRRALAWDETAPGRSAQAIDASLLGIDISGFTALSERLAERGKLGAEELIRLISDAYAGLIDIAERHGGDVLKFRGDALLMLFDGDSHEQRAARAALAMQAFIREAGRADSSVGPVTLAMAAGVVSGECHLFLVGSRRRELMVCGPAATRTLGLEDDAQAGEILVSARTAEALPAGVVAGPRESAFLLRADAELDAPLPPRLPDALADAAQFVAPALRDAIASGAVEAEHRRAAAAFLRFRGGDALAGRGEEGARSLAALADVVTEITDELGITWLESDIDRDGGKLYLVAGAPVTSGDEDERMLRALRAIVDAGVGPAVGVGVNRGPVLTGPIGSWSRRTYAVMGDTVNLAARLASRAEPGEILATGDVLQRAHTRYETAARQFLMKGKARPVTGYAVGVAAGGQSDHGPSHTLPLVGRDEELAALRAAVDAARARQSGAFELVGEAGAGKSRLLEELLGGVLGFQVLRAQCDPYSAATPFAPFRALIRPLIGAMPDEQSESVGAKLETFVRSAMPDLAPWTPLLAMVLDATAEPTREVDEIDPAFRRDRLHDVVDELLSRLLLMPTVVVVEDTHWLDDASQLVLRRLARQQARPWLFLFTRRATGPQLVDDESIIALGRLDAEASRALALAAAGDAVLSEEEIEAVTQRAAGNPLFVRELASAPQQDGGGLPETVESLLTARIDTLDTPDRRLLRHAAVIGTSFDLDLLLEILPDEVGDPDVWARLSEFVEWDGPAIRFRHELVRAAAYDGLSFERRREIHFAVGSALERRQGERSSPDVLSLHFLAAEQFERAWRYAVVAGDAAREKYANVDAATFYRRALAAAGAFEPPREELSRVWEALGDVLELAAHYEEADSAYVRAFELGGYAARLLRKRGVVSERRGRYDEALSLFERAEAEGDPEETVASQLGRATVLYRQGHIDECAHWAGLAAEGATAIGDRSRLADAYYVRAAAEGDRSGPASDFLDRALAIFQELGLLHREATVLNNMGVRAYYEGDWEAAVELYLRAEEVVRRAGDVLTGAHTLNNRAEILLDQGRLDDATALLEEALRRYRAASFPIGEALVMINLGRVAAAQGRFADGRERFDTAAERLSSLGSESFLLEEEARRAEAYVLEGRSEDAADAASRALDGMRRTGEIGVRTALLERVLGLAAAQARRRDEAAAHLARSLEVARELRADYEVARTLEARAVTALAAPGEAEEAARLRERLGVVATPPVPLP